MRLYNLVLILPATLSWRYCQSDTYDDNVVIILRLHVSDYMINGPAT